MAEQLLQKRNAVYECVDMNPEAVDGMAANVNAALMYFTMSTCNYGLPCPAAKYFSLAIIAKLKYLAA